ncbi:MAG: RidA family protein [Pseudomonadales bacterium]
MVQRLNKTARMSQIVTHNGTVMLAGQVAKDATADLAGQTAQILAQIESLLAEVGSTKSDVLSANIWLSDIRQFAQMNEVWDAWVDSENPPVRACVEARLARVELQVEIQVTAVHRG